MVSFQFGSAGVHTRAGPDFKIHRPRGSGDFVFLMFHAPVAVIFGGSEEVHYTGAGACIYYTPGHQHLYWGVNAHRQQGILDNSFVHFHGRRAPQLAAHYGVPRNCLMYPRHPEQLLRCLERIRQELLGHERFWETRASLALEELLLLAGRNAVAAGANSGNRKHHRAEMNDVLHALRTDVHQNLSKRWTIPAMAQRANLSPSRFAALYRESFGVAPIDDLIDARLSRARELLTNTTLPVKTVAAMSGFENIYYFSRIFRKRIGLAPSKYYQRTVR